MLSLKVFDVASIAHGQGEFINPFEQAFMPKGIHGEGVLHAQTRGLHGAGTQVNRDLAGCCTRVDRVE